MKPFPIKSFVRIRLPGDFGYILSIEDVHYHPPAYVVVVRDMAFMQDWSRHRVYLHADLSLVEDENLIIKFLEELKLTTEWNSSSEETFLEALIENKVGIE